MKVPRVHINDKLHTSAETSTLDGEWCLRVETRKKSEDAASVPRSKKSSRPERLNFLSAASAAKTEFETPKTVCKMRSWFLALARLGELYYDVTDLCVGCVGISFSFCPTERQRAGREPYRIVSLARSQPGTLSELSHSHARVLLGRAVPSASRPHVCAVPRASIVSSPARLDSYKPRSGFLTRR